MNDNSLDSALAVLVGQSGIQVCLGHNEAIIRLEEGEYVRIESEIQMFSNSVWHVADFNQLVPIALSKLVAGVVDDAHFQLEFEKGTIRMFLPKDGFEAITIVGRNDSVLFVA